MNFQRVTHTIYVWFLLLQYGVSKNNSETHHRTYHSVLLRMVHSCDDLVYCQGKLLETVQLARLSNDSKAFVDMMQKNPPNITLANFERFMQKVNHRPTKDEVRQFVDENFLMASDVIPWIPPDYTNTPKLLERIDDVELRNFTRVLVGKWLDMARKVAENVYLHPDRYSLISVPNGFIIPGGRFREMYYWDTYWIIKGLLLCDMRQTVRGILDNFLYLVRKFGFIPSATRVYYLNRSQPPLLVLSVGLYIDEVDDLDWLRQNIGTLEDELLWWIKKRTVVVEIDGLNYTLAHFLTDSDTPRPESYFEDFHACRMYGNAHDEKICYKTLKSAAESGWDFSSRWLGDPEYRMAPKRGIKVIKIIAPVDLNSFLCQSFKEISRFYDLLGNKKKSAEWYQTFSRWKATMELVFYDQDDGIWYDYDVTFGKPRKNFYLSNFAPLWNDCYDVSLRKLYGSKAVRYFLDQDAHIYEGGVPISMTSSEEQWDWPNVWPPLQDIIVTGFKKTGDEEAVRLAEDIARKWVNTVKRGYENSKHIYEKYDATSPGKYGTGGEYVVQAGFGWTNGVTLAMIDAFYSNGSSRKEAEHT